MDDDSLTPTVETYDRHAADYVGYFCDRFDISSRQRAEIEELLMNLSFVGGNPLATAAAAVYEVAGRDRGDVTLRDTARVTKLTKETIWRHTRKL